MIFLYIFVALFIAWIWVDYFRLIDIFEKNNLWFVALVFVLGAGSVLIVTTFQKYVLYPSAWDMNGNLLNDFLYSIFGIGLLEEIAKITPFLLFQGIFRKKLREPIDYLAFVCVSALGFSAAENVLYFQSYGSEIITSRSILCSISHMFDAAIVGYGFILLRFHPKFKNPLIIFSFLLLAALTHGIYDFLLMFEGISYGIVLTILFYFITISVFATIINNSLNNSAHFTYKKVINNDQLTKKMFTYYAIVFLIQFVLVTISNGFLSGLFGLLFSFFFSGLIVLVSVLRLSRFTLIEGRWNKIKLELPFHILGNGKDSESNIGLRIKGPSHNETYLSELFEEYVHLIPVNGKRSPNPTRLGYIEQKVFVQDDKAHYLVRVFHLGRESSYETILIKPKLRGISHTKSNYPIVAVMQVYTVPNPNLSSGNKKKYRFIEWAYIRKTT